MNRIQPMPDPLHSDKGPWIVDLEEGQRFFGFFLARNPQLETFRDASRGHYLRLQLADRTGIMEARIWENADKLIPVLESSRVVKVDGAIEKYRDQLQIRVIQLRAAKDGEFDLSDLRPTTLRDMDEMNAIVDATVAAIQDPYLQRLVQYFYADPEFRREFQEAPAGIRIHHAFIGGLLEHTFEIIQLAHTLLDLYPQINRDMLMAGILLHDIGKLVEFDWDEDIEYTDRGRLIGHVVISSEQVSKAIDTMEGFPEEMANQLQHLILAHHGRYEFGSPRRPKSLEAIALHHLENLDAQVNRFANLISQARKAGRDWTTYDSMLGRSLYAGSEDDISIEEAGWAD
jgi:3'-5' exoribonuclease